MSHRDDVYNRSVKGKARNARREGKRKRKRYKARWIRQHRLRKQAQ